MMKTLEQIPDVIDVPLWAIVVCLCVLSLSSVVWCIVDYRANKRRRAWEARQVERELGLIEYRDQ